MGTVLGHAEFGDYLSVYQGVTVGGNVDKSGEKVYPKLGNYVTMYAHSSALGNSETGDYVILSANSLAFNEKIPANSLVLGQSPNLTVKTYTQDYIRAKPIKEWIFEKDRYGNKYNVLHFFIIHIALRFERRAIAAQK